MQKLNYKSNIDEIGNSLMETLTEIKKEGETKELKFDMLVKYGRVLFLQNEFGKSYQTFEQAAIHAIENNISEIKSLYYWTARCLEENGAKEAAFKSYLILLDNKQFTANDEEFIDIVLDRLNFFENLEEKIINYKIQKAEELENPTDLLGKLMKYFKVKKL